MSTFKFLGAVLDPDEVEQEPLQPEPQEDEPVTAPEPDTLPEEPDLTPPA